MIVEWGHLALILALAGACWQAASGLATQAPERLTLAAAWLQWVATSVAAATLIHAFVGHDFSVTYVIQHSNRTLPLVYRVAALWGGHEGSMLLWSWILATWTLLAGYRLRRSDPHLARLTVGVLGVVACGMLLFILLTSNPFIRTVPAAQDGLNLNPLLQDPGLVLHPPLLYLGYVGTAIPFAVVMALMLSDQPGTQWPRLLRPFVLWAFACLTLGIALGSWWAYYELGWGGWWFWDPVENASFMPWLGLAALLHVLAVRDQRGSLGVWTGVLCTAVFVLSLIGTFLVRSGVLTSVHAFATDPRRGTAMLAMVAVTLLAAMSVTARSGHRLVPTKAPPAYHLASREGLLAAASALLLTACGTVLLGTLYPLAMDALGLGKLSVGPPYFDAVMLPLTLPLLPLAVVGPWLTWAAIDPHRLWHQLRLALTTGCALALALPLSLQQAFDRSPFLACVALGMCLCLAVSSATHAWRQRRQGVSAWGLAMAHIGLAVFAAGVTMVHNFGIERDVALRPGDTTTLRDCRLRFDGVTPVQGDNYQAMQGQFTLQCGDSPAVTMQPEKRAYPGSQMPMTESAIDWHPLRDIYVALADMTEGSPDGQWNVRLQYKPLMRWVWAGALLMAVGAALASLSRRLRKLT